MYKKRKKKKIFESLLYFLPLRNKEDVSKLKLGLLTVIEKGSSVSSFSSFITEMRIVASTANMLEEPT